jgi:hypothetical protein
LEGCSRLLLKKAKEKEQFCFFKKVGDEEKHFGRRHLNLVG